MYAIYAFVWQIYVPKGTYHVDLLSKHCPGPRIRQFPGIASWVASFQIVTWRVWPKDLSNVCQIVIIAVMLCPITKKKTGASFKKKQQPGRWWTCPRLAANYCPTFALKPSNRAKNRNPLFRWYVFSGRNNQISKLNRIRTDWSGHNTDTTPTASWCLAAAKLRMPEPPWGWYSFHCSNSQTSFSK